MRSHDDDNLINSAILSHSVFACLMGISLLFFFTLNTKSRMHLHNPVTSYQFGRGLDSSLGPANRAISSPQLSSQLCVSLFRLTQSCCCALGERRNGGNLSRDWKVPLNPFRRCSLSLLALLSHYTYLENSEHKNIELYRRTAYTTAKRSQCCFVIQWR